jgi:hypothetical protein
MNGGMAAFGTKLTFADVRAVVAIEGKADKICSI